MICKSLDSDASHAMINAIPDGRLEVGQRTTAGEVMQTSVFWNHEAPVMLKLIR